MAIPLHTEWEQEEKGELAGQSQKECSVTRAVKKTHSRERK